VTEHRDGYVVESYVLSVQPSPWLLRKEDDMEDIG
jgi:hypothetical protein